MEHYVIAMFPEAITLTDQANLSMLLAQRHLRAMFEADQEQLTAGKGIINKAGRRRIRVARGVLTARNDMLREQTESEMTELKSYRVWDAPTRWFHWINFLCVLALIAIGVAILNAKALGATDEGKILLKSVHVWFGYVFVLNLLWRMVWAFIGNRYARWGAMMPGGHGYWRSIRSYVAGLCSGQPQQYLGHNPLARIAVALLFLLLLIQAVSGLVLAGTDIFYPPLGSWIANWVAAPGVDPASLQAYSPHLYDEVAWQEMRAFRKPFITAHYYCFYATVVMIVLHILGVVMTELKEGGNIVSAMFTGKKTFGGKPVDE